MLFYDNGFGTNDGSLEECEFCKIPGYLACGEVIYRKQK